MKKRIIKLLSNLSAFNKLDKQIVLIITDVFKVNAVEICREEGITYFISK